MERTKWINYDALHYIHKDNGMIVLKTADLNNLMVSDVKGFDILYSENGLSY